MNPLTRIAGQATDRMFGLGPEAVPYVVRRDVAVPMPDGVALVGDHYRPAGARRAASRGADPLAVRAGGGGGTGVCRAAGAAGVPGVHPEHAGDVRLGRPVPAVQHRAGGRPGHRGVAARPAVVRRAGGDDRGQLPGAHPVGGRAVRRAAAGLGVDAHHRRELQPRVLPARHAEPAEHAELGRAGRQAGAGPARRHPEPAAGGQDAAGAAARSRCRPPTWTWPTRRSRSGGIGPGTPSRATSSGRRPITTRADLTRLPPVNMVSGWWDLFVPLQLRDFAAIRAAGGTGADHRRAVVARRARRDEGHDAVGRGVAVASTQRRRAAAGRAGPGLPAAGRQLAGVRFVAAAGCRRRPPGTCAPEVTFRARLRLLRPATHRTRSSTTRPTRRRRSAGRCFSRRASRWITRPSRPGRTC